MTTTNAILLQPITTSTIIIVLSVLIAIFIFIFISTAQSSSTFYQRSRLKRQRAYILQLQQYILPPALCATDEEWGDSMMRYYSIVIYLMITLSSSAVVFTEGYWVHAYFALSDSLCILLARFLIKDKTSVADLLLATKLAMFGVFLSQVASWTMTFASPNPKMLERGMLSRVLSICCFFESWEDIVIAMSITTFTICMAAGQPSDRHRFIMLYFKNLLLLFLLVVSGIRGRVAGTLNKFSQRISNVNMITAMTFSVVPLFAISAQFADPERLGNAPLWRTKFLASFLIVLLVPLSTLPVISKQLDSSLKNIVSRATSRFQTNSRKSPTKRRNSSSLDFNNNNNTTTTTKDDEFDDNDTINNSSKPSWLALILTFGLCGIFYLTNSVHSPVSFLDTPTHTVNYVQHQVNGIILITIITMVTLVGIFITLCINRFHSQLFHNLYVNQFVRMLLISSHGCMLIIMVLYNNNSIINSNIMIVGLCTIRALCGLERHTSFFLYVCQHVILALLSILVAHDYKAVGFIFLLTLSSLLVGFGTAAAGAGVAFMVQVNQDSQNMVEHALKQRFVATLTVLSEVLDEIDFSSSPDETSPLVNLSQQQQHPNNELLELLRQAKRQCEEGHDLTYLFTLIRRFTRTGSCGGNITKQVFGQVLTQQWIPRFSNNHTGHHARVEWYALDNDVNDMAFTLHYDLIRLVLFTILGGHHKKWHVYYSFNKQRERLVFTFKQIRSSDTPRPNRNNNNNTISPTSNSGIRRKMSNTTTTTTTWRNRLLEFGDIQIIYDAISATLVDGPGDDERTLEIPVMKWSLRRTIRHDNNDNSNDDNNSIHSSNTMGTPSSTATAAELTISPRFDNVLGNNPFAAHHNNINRISATTTTTLPPPTTTTTTATTQTTPRSSISSSNSSNKPTELPPNLIYGILDDTQLVRVMLLRSLTQHCNASPKSFTLGSHIQDIDLFVERCLRENVDVVILDLNLEFTIPVGEGQQQISSSLYPIKESDLGTNSKITLIHGSQIAKLLKKREFKGTIILYSANDKSGVEARHFESVDGFLEKTLWKTQHVKNTILKAIQHREQTILKRGLDD
jgi:hypothetical protein